jgi:glucuronosyltransferase
MKLILALILAVLCSFAGASRILFIFPSFSKSHVIVAQSLAELLAQRGHDVTVVSPFPMKKKVENLREIKSPIPEEYEELSSKMMSGNVSRFAFMLNMGSVVTIGEKASHLMLEMPEFKQIQTEKFDLMVIGFFMNEMLLGLSHHFQCPSMVLSANAAMTFNNIIFGNPMEVNAVPSMMFETKGSMSFLKRVGNFMGSGLELLMAAYIHHKQRTFYE